MIGLLLFLCLTRPTPDQIHDWTRVTPPPTSHASRSTGTTLTLDQLPIDPFFIADWSTIISTHLYNHYHVGLSLGQPNPVLIWCIDPTDDTPGSCTSGYPFWFTDR